MTKSNRIRLMELTLALILGLGTALVRSGLANKLGTALHYGGTSLPMGWLYAAYALCVLALAACAVFLRQDNAGQTIGSGFKAASMVAAVGMMAAGGLLFYENLGDLRLIIYVQAAFLIICGVTQIMSAVREGSGLSGIFSLFPLYYLCIMLFIFYRENAKNPSSGSFATEVIAIIAVMLAAYSMASIYFEKPKPRAQLALCLSAVYFASMEGFTFLINRSLVVSTPGVSHAMVLTLAAMGIYAACGVFRPVEELPAPKHELGSNASADDIFNEEAGEDYLPQDEDNA